MCCMKASILTIVYLFALCGAQSDITGNIFAVTTTTPSLSPMTGMVLHFQNEFFNKYTKSLSFIVHTRTSGSLNYFRDLLTPLLKSSSELKVQVRVNLDTRDLQSFEMYNILMTDSYNSLANLDPGWYTQRKDFSEYYLIALYPIFTRSHLMYELKQIFDYCWRHFILNVDVLVEINSTALELYTYFPFSHDHCKGVLLKQLNYGKPIVKLSATQLFPDKLRNLYGCKLTAVLWNVPPYIVLPEGDNTDTHFGGMEGTLLHLLATQLNFTVDYIVPPRNEQRGLVMANGTLTGAIKLLADKAGDLSLGSFRRTLERSTVLSSSLSFYQTTQVLIMLAQNKPWSSFEILTYPFNIYVWCLLIAFYILPILLACVLHRLHNQTLQLIYGVSKARHVFFIWTGILLCQSVKPAPFSNFARYVFTMWLILTLILQSSYQALLYEFFHTHKTIALPSTLEELIQRQYKLVVNQATADALSGIKPVRNRKIDLLVLDLSDTGSFAVLEENPHKLFAASTPRDFLNYYVIRGKKFGIFNVLNDYVYSQHISIYFTKHSYMRIPVNDILWKLRSGGIIEYWSHIHIGTIDGVEEKKRELKRSLTLTQFYGIFGILFCLWCIALVVFFAECLMRKRILKA